MEKEEIERKFIFIGSDDIYKGAVGSALCQSYVSTQPEVRLRQVLKEGKLTHFLTVKDSGDMVRNEYQTIITAETYADLHKNTVGTDIIKTRYKVPVEDGLIAVIDVFKDINLKTVEVEFTSKKKALDFEPPAWFGKEVTCYPHYKNKYIAKYGLNEVCGAVI